MKSSKFKAGYILCMVLMTARPVLICTGNTLWLNEVRQMDNLPANAVVTKLDNIEVKLLQGNSDGGYEIVFTESGSFVRKIAKGGKTLFTVDKSFQAGDEAVEVYINGRYELNPTATT